jgi:16S rRNA (uracil1498-N3)-methyltransferase
MISGLTGVMSHPITKYPRLYTPENLQEGLAVLLSADQAHYLKNVLRRTIGDHVRVFNGRDGEWLAAIETLDKKSGTLKPLELLKNQELPARRIHLHFALIKKARLDFLVEKAVELGATDLHPVVTRYCDVRAINHGRMEAQIIEAAEQCERQIKPTLHPLKEMRFVFHNMNMPVLACIERGNYEPVSRFLANSGYNQEDIGALIGPEGGFSDEEIESLLNTPHIKPVSLGNSIYRSETAALKILSLL